MFFLLRLGYDYSINYGQDYRTRDASAELSAATGGKLATGQSYLPNFKTNLHQGSVDLIASLNSISPYHGNPHVNFYALLGYSFYYGKVGANLLDASGDAYDFTNLTGSRSDIKDAVKDVLKEGQSNSLFKTGTGNDKDKYETNLSDIRDGNRDDVVGKAGWNTKHGLNAGLGVAFRFGAHFNLGIEQKFGYIFDNGTYSGLVVQAEQRNTILSSTRIRFNFNLGSTSKRLEPLWWVNPNNYVYDRLAVKDVLPDADGDGVTDQFDLEPNTPAGCPVDTHGRSLDTDGDGVPDCRDKQVLTPQNWFPVDADGVGTEPTPQCCKDLLDSLHNLKLAPAGCGISSLPSVHFSKSGVKLSDESKSTLDAAVAQLNASPDCKVKLVGYGASNKRAQQLSWDRVNAVKSYLVEKGGIAEGRIIFTYGYDGDANTVDLQPTTEEGPSTVPAPHPNLQKS
ncbi:MAG: OmpA family protein [Arachidicoccus sp.]|nr:OmpA family protein [Arachidicoccus sp.]